MAWTFSFFLVFSTFFIASTSSVRVYSWGLNSDGQLGLGDRVRRTTEARIRKFDNKVITALSAGEYHSLAVDVNGTVYAWGQNLRGQLGMGDEVERIDPAIIPTFVSNPVLQVVSLHFTSIALSQQGKIYTWGAGDTGQLGIGSNITNANGQKQRNTPQLLDKSDHDPSFALARFTQIAVGSRHALALEDNGRVWVWGGNSEGQLGLGDYTQRDAPVWLDTITDFIVSISAGDSHSVAITSTGRVYAWGVNRAGQLGMGDVVSRRTPSLIPVLSDSAASPTSSVKLGLFHSIAMMNDGKVQTFGSNEFGQLGIGRIDEYVAEPISVSDLNELEVARAVAGQRHSVFLTEVGEVLGCGNNDFGMLGTGDETQRNAPTKMSALQGSSVFAVGAGAYHTLAAVGCFDVPRECSGHGNCTNEGECSCFFGYTGEDCSVLCQGGGEVQQPCSRRGMCKEDGACTCAGGYYGGGCEQVCPGAVVRNITTLELDGSLRYRYTGLGDLYEITLKNENGSIFDYIFLPGELFVADVCSGHGECTIDGGCICDDGYAGDECDFACPGELTNPCSGLGTCTRTGECECLEGFTGDLCNVECKGGAATPCNYHGVCTYEGDCICEEGYRGESCQIECDGGADSPCSGHGFCLDDGSCSCRDGYHGDTCSYDCPGGIAAHLDGYDVIIEVCSGHGECNDYSGNNTVEYLSTLPSFTEMMERTDQPLPTAGYCECTNDYTHPTSMVERWIYVRTAGLTAQTNEWRKALDCSEPPPPYYLLVFAGLAFLTLVAGIIAAYVLRKKRLERKRRREKRRRARKKMRKADAKRAKGMAAAAKQGAHQKDKKPRTAADKKKKGGD
mmetsp:Transcript_29576/g.76393  ORF Transcript_29576/g.76393 Transcript_29576/m.76393 type:complete len:845 (-) Transcript_29576:395-2929(-)